MKYQRKGSHSVHQLTAHIVFATKYRFHVLVGDKQIRCRDEIKIVCDILDVNILKVVVTKDHNYGRHFWGIGLFFWFEINGKMVSLFKDLGCALHLLIITCASGSIGILYASFVFCRSFFILYSPSIPNTILSGLRCCISILDMPV